MIGRFLMASWVYDDSLKIKLKKLFLFLEYCELKIEVVDIYLEPWTFNFIEFLTQIIYENWVKLYYRFLKYHY